MSYINPSTGWPREGHAGGPPDFYQNDEPLCERCRNYLASFTMRERDDGTWYEVKDGTLRANDDLELCADCAEEIETTNKKGTHENKKGNTRASDFAPTGD